MRSARTPAKSTRKSGTNWNRLGTRTEAEILAGIAQDPDARATDEAFWKGARRHAEEERGDHDSP